MSDLLEYKCPCCGGAIAFDSASQKMKCPYCDTEFDVETLIAYDAELKKDEEKTDSPSNLGSYDENSGSGDWQEGECDNMVSYVCDSCGGEIVGDENLAASSCPYCGNPVIIKHNFSGMLRPDFVIPFKLDRVQAKKAMAEHLRGKKLLPGAFKDEAHIDEIVGCYVPFWLYDAKANASMRYRATRTSTWSDSRYIYTRTDHFLLTREGSVSFQRVPEDGSSKMNDDYMESVEPYDYSALTDFQTAYLAGYFADRYDLDAQANAPRAEARMKASTEKAFSATVGGYVGVTPESSNINYSDENTSYAMLPVWVLNTKYKGKVYRFAMNGQTGKFIGELPCDRGKYWMWVAIVFGISAAVCALILALLGLL